MEKRPLSHSEYRAMMQLFGIASIFETCGADLKKRVQDLIPNGWRDIRMIQTVAQRVTDKLVETVPLNKLRAIRQELDRTICEIKVLPPVKDQSSLCTYVEQDALERIANRAMINQCYLCGKCGGDARACELRKDIERLYNWDFPKIKNGESCYFAGASIESIKGGIRDDH